MDSAVRREQLMLFGDVGGSPCLKKKCQAWSVEGVTTVVEHTDESRFFDTTSTTEVLSTGLGEFLDSRLGPTPGSPPEAFRSATGGYYSLTKYSVPDCGIPKTFHTGMNYGS